jgi:hypothetical protein
MAAKKKKGAPVVDLTLATVKAIAKKLDRLTTTVEDQGTKLDDHGAKIDSLTAKVDHLGADHGAKLQELSAMSLTLIDRVDRLQDETIKGFTLVRRESDGTNRRIESLRDTIGERVRSHDRRLDAIELELGSPKDPHRS